MFLKILKMILYFFIIFAKPVYADNFDGTLDTSDNQYVQTIAFAVSDYPTIKNILYEKNTFIAEDTDLILVDGQIESFIDFDGTRRIPMVADSVSAPPGTQVDVVYLYKNSTGHGIEISKVDWVLSRNIKENGSLIDILEISGYAEGNLGYKYSNQNLIKSGIYKEYVGKGMVSDGGTGAYILESVTVKNPLNVDDTKVVLNDEGGVDFEIYIQNMSKEFLNDLKFEYGPHEEVFSLGAGEEYVVKFSTLDIPLTLGTFSVYNPNIKETCAVSGSPYYTYTQTDAIPVLAHRGADIVPGATVQPVRESFCIKRIPYTMISEAMVLSQVETVSEEEEVLGTSDEQRILPKTGQVGMTILTLLVVDVLLWYSLYILRRNHESKNTNSRIRTKSK